MISFVFTSAFKVNWLSLVNVPLLSPMQHLLSATLWGRDTDIFTESFSKVTEKF